MATNNSNIGHAFKQQQRRDNCLDENHVQERKKIVDATLDEIEELLLNMSLVHSKVNQLVSKLQVIQKSEKDLSHRCLGRELGQVTTTNEEFERWNYQLNRDLKFMKECVALRCNDEKFTCLDFDPNNDDYEILIGDCLTHNTHVSDLTVNLSRMHRPYNDDIVKSFETVLCYIGSSSTSLQRLHIAGGFRSGECTDEIIQKLLNAIENNPNIKEIHWHVFLPPTAALQVLMEATTSRIKCLSVKRDAWDAFTVEHGHLLPHLIANCVSLAKLRLKSRSYSWTDLESILDHLADVPMKLEELAIEGNDVEGYDNVDQLPSLTRYLQMTTTLQHLELKHFKFDSDNIQSILEDLQSHYSSPTACISKLSIQYCNFDEVATDKFSNFLKATRYNESIPCAVLQELEMSLGWQISAPSSFSAAILTSLAYPPHVHLPQLPDRRSDLSSCTIGSGLRTLKLEYPKINEEFSEAIRTNAKCINISSLHFSGIGHEKCAQLASCIPELLSLQELHLDEVDREDFSYVLILSMIQRCGNLRTVSIRDDDGDTLLNDTQSRVANGFCERNQVLPLLFSREINWDWRYSQPNRSKCCTMSTLNDYDTALLLPLLLHVAKQVPVTRVSTIMKGLLHLIVDNIASF